MGLRCARPRRTALRRTCDRVARAATVSRVEGRGRPRLGGAASADSSPRTDRRCVLARVLPRAAASPGYSNTTRLMSGMDAEGQLEAARCRAGVAIPTARWATARRTVGTSRAACRACRTSPSWSSGPATTACAGPTAPSGAGDGSIETSRASAAVPSACGASSHRDCHSHRVDVRDPSGGVDPFGSPEIVVPLRPE